MKLWDKEYYIKNKLNSNIESFTIGKDHELDLLLAPYDIIGSLAHINMLESIGILTKKELLSLVKILQEIYIQIIEKKFQIKEGVEDIHSQIEITLIERLGDIGKKIHTGRSRNDQILVDLKLFIRNEIYEIVNLISDLFNLLIVLSNRYKDILMPGYTHYQIAMPSSFGLWFGAYAESLTDDILIMRSAYKFINKNPLGSAAGYGSPFPLNRRMTTELLGFEELNYNVIYAQMGRGKTERIVAQALTSITSTLGKFAQDICLYMSQNFGFISFPDCLTTGSSIMPHKKNPDVFELIRAHCNRIMALPNEITLITTNLSSGYHRDLQLIKENFLPAFNQIKICLNITKYMLKHIKIKKNILEDKKYEHIFSVEVISQLIQNGMSFRDAYKKVGLDIEKGYFKHSMQINHSHEGSISNLCNQDIIYIMEKYLKSFHFEKYQNAINKLLGITK